ncbi:hypothetical protein GCM10007385_00920 [Tateyamaria omphalii]|uniref:hypothetical protein n=1 Tax=Tateyamaria omphalii TaxID=299262 RepID=UPI00167A8D7C|nr:hypothetical protein [Tateyamaria omphalii]GGX37976.1 hypothetical protein GCM10007385_00920 [Tateyamaria omphalii]
MANNTYKIRRLDDRALFDLMNDAKAAVEAADPADQANVKVSCELTFTGHNLIGHLNFSDQPPKAGRYAIQIATLTLQSKNTEAIRFLIQKGSDGEYDDFQLPQNAHGPRSAEWKTGGNRAAFLAAHDTLTTALAPTEADPDTPTGQLTNFAQNIDVSVRGFAQSLESTLHTLAEQRIVEQEHNKEERERLRLEMEQQRALILKQANKEIATRQQQLEDRKQELDTRESELLLKSHKDARRQAFETLLQNLQDLSRRPKASADAFRSRIMIFLAMIGSGVAAGWFALSSMTPDDLPNSATEFQTWVTILKPIGLSLLSLGAFAAAIQWLRHFYTQDLRFAEENERFGHDMARASWVMEAYLEMTQEHGIKNVPKEWMRNATEGLFQRGGATQNVDEAAQAFAALLGMAGSVKAGPNGFEAQVGKRNLSKMSKVVHGGDD